MTQEDIARLIEFLKTLSLEELKKFREFLDSL